MRNLYGLCILVTMLATLCATVAMMNTPVQSKNPFVDFDIAGKGKFTMELLMDDAPRTAGNIKRLVDMKFYDGIIIHRYVKGFVVQAGDPQSKSMMPSEVIARPGENGGTDGLGDDVMGPAIQFEPNKLSHIIGTVGIALESPADNSGASQWFINLADNKRLDGKYVVFARITSGMDVVMNMRRGDLIKSAKSYSANKP